MKLITKTLLVYLAVTLVLFLAGGIVFYNRLRALVDEEVTENLYRAKENAEAFIASNGNLPPEQILFGGNFSVSESSLNNVTLLDTLIYDKEEDEYLAYRILKFPLAEGSEAVAASVSLPLFESDDLIETIGLSLIAISFALVAVLILLGGFFSKRMWKPFFETLEALGYYQATLGKPLKFGRSRTKEFARLNAAIEEMTAKIDANFKQLRSFTENASHEIQTPVTAIRFEAELLMQNTSLPEATLAAIHQIHQTASRLGKINESLLLLAKIGNNQFPDTEVNITLLLREKLELFQDRIQLKNIAVDLKADADVIVKSSPELAGIVVANLISNAIRHNVEGGKIEIRLTSKSLEIANTGEPLPFDEKQLFQRFVHNIKKHESTGLGLALVKEIANINKWIINYRFEQGHHVFLLIFS